MAEGESTDWGGLIGLIGAAGIASAGSLLANYQNRKLQKSINEDVINLANTAHQREVADLRAAGLNPILSATGNGASVPSLGTPHQDNVLSSFGNSARAIGETLSQQRRLSNEGQKLANEGQAVDNESVALDNRVMRDTLDSQIYSAKEEARARGKIAQYEREVAEDRFGALQELKYRGFIHDGKHFVGIPNLKYNEMIKDQVKAEINTPWRTATQSWVNSAKGVADTVINGIGTGVRAKQGSRSARRGSGFQRRR